MSATGQGWALQLMPQGAQREFFALVRGPNGAPTSYVTKANEALLFARKADAQRFAATYLPGSGVMPVELTEAMLAPPAKASAA